MNGVAAGCGPRRASASKSASPAKVAARFQQVEYDGLFADGLAVRQEGIQGKALRFGGQCGWQRAENLVSALRNGCRAVSGIAFGPNFSSRRRASSLVRPVESGTSLTDDCGVIG